MVAWISAFAAETTAAPASRRLSTQRQTGGTPALAIAGVRSRPAVDRQHQLVTVGAIRGLGGAWTYWQYTTPRCAAGCPGYDRRQLAEQHRARVRCPSQPEQSDQRRVSLTANALDGGGAVTFGPRTANGPSIDASTGVISGHWPARAAPFPVSVTATATGDPRSSQKFSWDVHGQVTPGRLTGRHIGRQPGPVDQSRPRTGWPAARCGSPHRACRVASRSALRAADSGWPSVSGQYTVSVHVTDSTGAALATGSFPWTIARASGRGPAGHIRLSRDGKCLAAASATRHRDRALQLRGAAALDDRGRRLHPRRRAVPGRQVGELVVGRALRSRRATAGSAGNSSSNAVLTYLSDGNCLADTGAKNGSRAVAALCQATPNNTGSASTPSPSQQWILPAGPLTSGIAGYCASNVHRAEASDR